VSAPHRAAVPRPPAPAADAIAIIGIGCRYPGVHGPRAFWDLVRSGRNAVTAAPPERIALGYDLDRYLDPRPRIPGRISSPYAGFLEHPDRFDPAPFGLMPREVRSMEPQQRLMVEVAWDAIVDAGIPPESLQGERVAVILGHMAEDYSRERIAVLGEEAVNRSLDVFTVGGMSRAVLSGRIAYLLGVTGPSFTLDTACSSSLIATHLACQSLLAGESRLALAGGVNLFLTPEGNIALSRSGMLAPDGKCKAFDARADGFVRAEGAGVVLLRPLRDALAANDPVYAVIRGTGISSDGRDGGHMMAPGRLGQAQAMRDAYARAAVSPADVDFVETHGTGTVIGDPVEIGALADVMGPGRSPDRPLRVSSVKGNIGHTESASGVAGLIRTALALAHRELPAQLHFEEPTPHIPWDDIPVRVQTEHAPWPGEGPRLAGVNSFGISGTNAHVVLESPPEPPVSAAGAARSVPVGRPRSSARGPWLFPFSAHDDDALDASLRDHAALLRGPAPPALEDLAYTLGQRRSHHPCRFATVASSARELADELEAQLARRPSGVSARGRAGTGAETKRVLVFPGQGSQSAGMGRGLLEHAPAFRARIEALDDAFARYVDWSLVDALRDPERHGTLTRLARLQPTLIAVEIGLAALWAEWGIVPDVVVGQSLGEIAAAHAAGCLDLDAVALLACHRGLVVERAAGRGAMSLVGLGEAEVAPLLRRSAGRLEIAGSSSPGSTIVAGDRAAVAAWVDELEARGVFARRLDVDFASHCFHMDPLLAPFGEAIAGLRPEPGKIPFYSTVDCAPVPGDSLDARYWVRNLRAPVGFTATFARLLDDGVRECLEVSPHPTLARAIPENAAARGVTVDFVPSLVRQRDELACMQSSLAQLYVRGARVDFAAAGPHGRVVRTEPYPYQRRRFWFGERSRLDVVRPAHPLLGHRTDGALDERTAVWQPTIDLDAAPWLADYRIESAPALPAALHIELALGAARSVWPEGALALRDVELGPVHVLGSPARATLQVALHRTGASTGEIRIAVREADGSWSRRAGCRVVAGDGVAHPRDASGDRDGPDRRPIAPDAWVSALGGGGLALGPRLRAARTIERDGGGVHARLALPRLAESESHAYQAHPALLESALLLADADGAASTPRAIAEIVSTAPLPPELDCEVAFPPASEHGSSGPGTLRLVDDTGRPVLTVRGLRTGPVGARATDATLPPVVVRPVTWRRLASPPPGPTDVEWLLCGDDESALAALAAELGKLGSVCRRRIDVRRALRTEDLGAPTSTRGVALVADATTAEDAERLATRLDEIVDGLLEEGATPERIWLVTRGPGADAPLADEAIATPRAPEDADRPRPHRVWLRVPAVAAPTTWADAARWMTADTGETTLFLDAESAHAPRLGEIRGAATPSPDARGWAPADERSFVARIVAPGEPDGVELRACPRPVPDRGGIRIAVEAAALTPAAADRALGRVSDPPTTADPTLETTLVGIVEALGDEASPHRVGDRVVVRGPIGRHACAPAAAATPLPGTLDPVVAAAHVDALARAIVVLEEFAQLQGDERVWIHGVDTTEGAAALAWARHRGARVVATGERAEGLRALAVLGIEATRIDSGADHSNALLRASEGEGMDVILGFAERLPVAGDLAALRPGGRLVDAHPRHAHDPEPVASLRLRANRSARSADPEDWRTRWPARMQERLATAADALARGAVDLPRPVVFAGSELARALRLLGQDRYAGPVVLDLRDAAGTRIRPADGRAPLLDTDRTYAVVCRDPGSARFLEAWMRARGAGDVVALAAAPSPADGIGPRSLAGVLAVDPRLGKTGPAPGSAREALPDGLRDWLATAEPEGFFVVVSRAGPHTALGLVRGGAAREDSLDRLVAERRRSGRDVTALHWAAEPDPGALAEALEAVVGAPALDTPFVALPRAGEPCGLDAGSPLFEGLVADGSAAPGAALREALAALPVNERGTRITALVLDAVAVVLGMGEGDRARLTPDAALDELGLDSLMTLELGIALHRDLGFTMERGALARGSTLGALAEAIDRDLAADRAGAAT
jgi:acyl transferase domain-containing protein/acyl carrier protein